ncbi:MAG TPA: antibiotic biosynthesis monooxygenase [Sphingobium sp.]|nr:antibiotic biosynthesis monooxygenase [Sphingobium sp.]
MIVVIGQIQIDPKLLPVLFGRLNDMSGPSRAEDGCIFYHMAVEDAEKGLILACEGWRDREALDRHLSLPEAQKLLADFEGQVTMDVQVHEVSASHSL